MLVSLTVGKVDAGVAVLLTEDKRLIEFPSILLPPNISCGSIVDITVARNVNSESKSQAAFRALQDDIYRSFGEQAPSAPVLRCRNATQTAVVLEWDPIELGTADIISLSLYRNGQKAGNIPRPADMHSTKISGLAVDTEYTFHLILRTTAGTLSSEKVTVKTHKMTDLTGITVTPGILPAPLRDSLAVAVERIGAKLADTVRIDTTHFVTTEGRGLAWEKAVEMNIPVVRPEWVEGCERSGRIVNVRHYYLDADPRQRQLAQSQVPPSSSHAEPPLPDTPTAKAEAPEKPQTNGDGESPRSYKSDEAEKAEKAAGSGDTDTEEQDSDEPDVDEQKMRIEDRDMQKVAIRPGGGDKPLNAGLGLDTQPTSEDEASSNSGAKDGAETPGANSFQDVAL